MTESLPSPPNLQGEALKRSKCVFLVFFFAGDQEQQDQRGWAGAVPPVPAVPAAAAGHAHPAVQRLGQYGYDEPQNVPSAFAQR